MLLILSRSIGVFLSVPVISEYPTTYVKYKQCIGPALHDLLVMFTGSTDRRLDLRGFLISLI